MDITIAICTWNRCELLDATLAQMRKLRIPAGVTWEILVVNNRCTDATDKVIEKHTNHLPLRGLYESKQGLSNARNCAIANARGSMLIWTDDDVLVDEAWLEAYHDAAKRYPEAAYFGGRIDPRFEIDPPKWIQQHLKLVAGPFALCDFGTDMRPFESHEIPIGASMAFRLDRIAGLSFDPELGRKGDSLVSGDETQAVNDLKRRGIQGVWVGPARVRHWVPKERMTKQYIWNWYYHEGVTAARMESVQGARVFGVPRWAVRQYLRSMALWALGFAFDRRGRMQAMRSWAHYAGLMAESRRRRMGPVGVAS